MNTNGQLDKDSYGTTYRECMKHSMGKPAGQWRPLNRRTYDLFDRLMVLGILGTMVFFFAWGAVELLARMGR